MTKENFIELLDEHIGNFKSRVTNAAKRNNKIIALNPPKEAHGEWIESWKMFFQWKMDEFAMNIEIIAILSRIKDAVMTTQDVKVYLAAVKERLISDLVFDISSVDNMSGGARFLMNSELKAKSVLLRFYLNPAGHFGEVMKNGFDEEVAR